MGANLGSFWDAASPGINSALDSARQHQHDRMKAEHDIIAGYTTPDTREDVRNQANQLLLQMAQDHVNGKYKAGSYLKNLAPWVSPQAGPPAPPEGDAGGGAGAPAPAAPASDSSKPVFTGSAPAAPSGQGNAALPSTSPTQGGGAPMQAPATPPPSAPSAPSAPGGPPAPASSAPPGPISQALAAHPATSDLMRSNGFTQEIAEMADALAAAGIHAPQAPDEKALRDRTAQQYGYSADELEKPDFPYKGGVRADPSRAKAQTEYRQRLQHERDQAGTEYRSERGAYDRALIGLVGERGKDLRTTAREDSRAREAEAAASRRDESYDRRASRREAERDKRAAEAEKARAQDENRRQLRVATAHADADYRKRMAEVAHLKPGDKFYDQTKAAAEEAKREAIEEARARYAEFGEGAEAPALSGPPPRATGAAPRPTPSASPTPKVSSGPPAPPAAVQRATALATRAKQLGGVRKLSPQEQQELHQLHQQGAI